MFSYELKWERNDCDLIAVRVASGVGQAAVIHAAGSMMSSSRPKLPAPCRVKYEKLVQQKRRLASGMIFNFTDSCLPSAVGATIKSIVGLNAVSDDLASAVITNGREFVDSTFETVERMTSTGRHNFE